MLFINKQSNILAPAVKGGARDQKEVTSMNKYELAVVVSAKIEDDERAAALEKCKALIERFVDKLQTLMTGVRED